MESQEQEREERLRMKAWSRRAKMRRLLEMEREQQAADAGASGKVRRLLDHDTESQHILGLLQVRNKEGVMACRRDLGPSWVCAPPCLAYVTSTADAHTPLPLVTATVHQHGERADPEAQGEGVQRRHPLHARPRPRAEQHGLPTTPRQGQPRDTFPSTEDSARVEMRLAAY